MKAKPVTLMPGQVYQDCAPKEATHLMIRMPGPTGLLVLPVMVGGTRAGTGNWTWNGNTEKPTLKPSILSRMGRDGGVVCHTFVNDGMVQFLDDCTHEHAGQTLELLDVK